MSSPKSLSAELVTATAAPYAVPVGVAGLDLRDGAASRSPFALRELLNGRFSHDRALAKRSGHVGSVMKSDDAYPQVAVEETRPWLYGWGDLSYQAYSSSLTKPPYFPEQTRGAGAAVLDDSLVASTGDRLLVRRPGNTDWLPSRGVPLYAPTAQRRDRVYPAQTTTPFSMNAWYDTAVSATHEVTLHLRNGGAANQLLVSVRDRSTDVVLDYDIPVSVASATITQGTVVHSAGLFVAIWADGANLQFSWATDANPTVWSAWATWDTGSGDFDVDVISDERFIVAFRDGGDIRITYWRGRVQENYPAAPGTDVNASGVASGKVAIAVGRDGDLGINYRISNGGGGVLANIFSAAGVQKTSSLNYNARASAGKSLAVAPHWNYSAGGGSQFTFWCEYTGTSGGNAYSGVDAVFLSSDLGAVTPAGHRAYFNATIATRGFRVGDVALVGLLALRDTPATPNFQSQYFFMGHNWDGSQRVVGTFLRGETVGYTSLLAPTVTRLSGVRPEPNQGLGDPASPTNPGWVTSVLRWPPIGLANLFSPQVRQCTIEFDFLPPFRAVQYGRALYTPGAVVNEFDGRSAFEAGFLQYPEIQIVASSASGGSLTAGDIRAYRIYACHSNASGEIARSSALTFIAPAVGGGNNNNVITFSPIQITSKPADEVFFEIYATTGSGAGPGATFYLVNQTTLNSLSAPFLSYTDTTSNTALLVLPADPHPAVPGLPGELLESAPPGCEIIASGKSRLWFAGGEVPRGRVAFSKLREEREQAGWSELTGYLDLDSTGKAVTSLACQSDVLVAFQADSTYGVQGDGPTNLGSGFFPPAQLLSAGVGTPYHCGTVVSEAGIAFWASAGPRLLTPGFQTVDISQEVEPLARSLVPTAAVAHPGVREIRWYTESGTALMWDYTGKGPVGNRWAQWSGLPAAGAVYYPEIDGAVLCQPSGRVLLESGSETTDGGNHFEFAFRTGDVRPADLLQGNNRFIRVAFAGEYHGEHTVGVWTYYDNAVMWDDYFTWQPSDALAVVPWGSGSGVWDTDPTAWIAPTTESPDGVYRFMRRLPRDRGATLSVRVSDLSAPTGSFSMDEVAFEIASENGLTKTPARTFGPLSP